ncbi:MAG: phage major capsid protein [Armatimonadetes bacterium]|nr:phage major capsid protein [Armatimonadota bacterium]
MDDLLRELREIKDQIRREHDPDRLQRAIREAVSSAPQGGGSARLGALEAAAAEAPTSGLKDLLARPARDAREAELQRLNDRLYLCAALLRRDPRTLRSYRDFALLAGDLRKALNTTDNAEFVPDSFSLSLIEEVRLQRRLPALFDNVTIPRSPLKWPVEGGIGLPYLVNENTSDTGTKVPVRNPATRGVTFSAKTIGVRVPFSHEFDEDSIVAAEEYVRRQIAKALTDGLETAILNGDPDTVHMDAVVTADNDVRRAFKGLRRLARDPSSDTEYDVTTGTTAFAQTDVVAVRQAMGAYGIDPRDLVLMVSVKTYYKIIGDSTNFGDFQTLDKVGPQAIALTGEVGALYGVPVVVSAYLPETCDGATVDAGTGTDAVMVIANRRAFALATQVGATIETVWAPECLQFRVIGYQRCDFQPWFDSTTERAASVGHSIAVG